MPLPATSMRASPTSSRLTKMVEPSPFELYLMPAESSAAVTSEASRRSRLEYSRASGAWPMRSIRATSTAATPAATPSTTVSRPIPNLCNAAVKPPTRPRPDTRGY